MREAMIAAAMAALSMAGAHGAWAQGSWHLVRARKAGLSFELPVGWKLTELALRAGAEERKTVVLVRASSPGTERPLSQMADLEIYVHSLPDETPVARWVSAEHTVVAAGRVGELSEARVAGLAGLARSVQFEGGEPMREVFLIARGRGLHIAWPQRPGLELAVQHALDTLALGAATGGEGDGVSEASGPQQSTGPYGIVHPRIVAPVGVPTRHDYRLVLTKAMQHLQLWYQAQLGSGLTFSMDDTAVLNSAQDEAWFANNPAGSDPTLWFWRNGLEEAFGMVGGWFYDGRNSWVIYVDVDPNCGSAYGSAANVVMVPRRHLRGLTQLSSTHRCPEDTPGNFTACQWVGIAGFNLGYALGASPPAGCRANDKAACPDNLLWGGSYNYPNTVLTPDEKAQLAASPFFSELNLTRPLFGCTKLFAPPQ
jgi:hypothetical protein